MITERNLPHQMHYRLQKKSVYNNLLDKNYFMRDSNWVTINMIHQIYNNTL